VLAAENRLVECLGVQIPLAARADQMARFRVNPIPPGDLLENSMPAPAMGPPVPVGGTPAGATPGEVMGAPTDGTSGR
jgi:adhesin transport system outer membrane protein